MTTKFGCKNYENKIGLLIVNLGTPEAPTKEALRPYLKEFLSDPRIIEINRVLWWLILNLIILNVRPKRSARLYSRIWMDEGSPLMVYTKKFVEKLKTELVDHELIVDYAMRYGSPSVESVIKKLKDQGCNRLVVMNMYPHYSATTVGSNLDAVFDACKKHRWVPSLKIIEPFYNHPAYLNAQAEIINNFYANTEQKPEKLVFSYHGVPIEYVVKGDPYCCQCNATTKLLLERLEVPEEEVIHTFQSRFGKAPWLQPYTDYTIQDLAKEGVKHIAVACPGFAADCLETLDEIGNEAQEEFEELGGEKVDLIPCLNDHDVWVKAAKEIILDEISNWLKQNDFKNYSDFDCSCLLNKCKGGPPKKCGKCNCNPDFR